jgi:hypothetical protein
MQNGAVRFERDWTWAKYFLIGIIACAILAFVVHPVFILGSAILGMIFLYVFIPYMIVPHVVAAHKSGDYFLPIVFFAIFAGIPVLIGMTMMLSGSEIGILSLLGISDWFLFYIYYWQKQAKPRR